MTPEYEEIMERVSNYVDSNENIKIVRIQKTSEPLVCIFTLNTVIAVGELKCFYCQRPLGCVHWWIVGTCRRNGLLLLCSKSLTMGSYPAAAPHLKITVLQCQLRGLFVNFIKMSLSLKPVVFFRVQR